ncbi:MAG: hypothetical protein J0M12_09535 [Deltaproteobacteria bacterium]|nr:hypothetical protein [Deltaproteobacteria bacterium]
MRDLFLAVLIALAAVTPLTTTHPAPSTGVDRFPGWPQEFRGNHLTQLPLTERELTFGKDFPGKIGRFSDGENELIIRWITRESRKLHPASDCFRGAGHSIAPLPLHKDLDGALWSCFRASRDHQEIRVCERIFDENGGSWSDTSSWFWDAARGVSDGPWWAITVAKSERRA